ncbi:LpqB family beta-propeller domain-containing protein [Rathayibacter soli]|uniref:LpqB family beta-propeller domain-containing protein n=1 Tax=Rathayibacter soli TaxID=3144168 RepID=UPI0027E59DF9|nr:LpqB family beta-propeller domain-containing protein [Glaciibacter superstes]
MKAKRMLAALTALLVIGLTGCATIPRSGPVEQGLPVQGQDAGFGPVDYLPSGPSNGATQKEILRGFVDAAVSPQNGYAVAQEFLTPKFSSTWNPDASVTIDTGTGRTESVIDKTHLQLSVTPTAFVDVDGNYRRSESSTALTQPYAFEKVGGQWRISKAPDGVVIDATRFPNVFSAHTLYFFSPDFRYLVPDERWFPSRASTQTRVVKALVSGPAKWLTGAVVTAFPQGTKLAVDSVSISADGQAQVPLNSAANGSGSATALTLGRMKLQLTQSLANVSSVTGVTISIAGVERSVADLGSSTPLQDPVVDVNPLVLKGGAFGFLSGSTVSAVPNMSDKIVALQPSAVTLSAAHDTAAVLTGRGVYDVRSSVDTPKLVDSRPGLIAPSLDNLGFVWSVPADDPSALQVTGADGTSSVIDPGWPDASAIRSIAVSRDGTRVAVLVQTANEQHVMAAGIVRGDANRPDHLTDPVDFGAVTGKNARSLTWLDELSVASLATDANGETTIVTQVIGGDQSVSSGPAAGNVLVGGNNAPPYWVLAPQQSLEGPRGTGWQQKSSGIALLATQLGKPS